MADGSRQLFVITGGPGSGKTTLIEALRLRGELTADEAGRAVIREQVRSGGSALPWSDRLAFAELMLARDLQAYQTALAGQRRVFFDRGIPDVAGYLRLSELPVPADVADAVHRCRYDNPVFIAPPWTEIFERDAERKQTFDEAVDTYNAMVETYTASGYELVTLPLAPVEERVDFVLRHLERPL